MRIKGAKVPDISKIHTNPGSPIHVIYSGKVMKDGTVKLQETGKENIKEKIQSFKSITDISFIRQRLMMGDESVLNRAQAFFGDYTGVPDSMPEVLQMFIDGEQAFYSLDPEMRNKFDNDYRKWFATAFTDEWINKMGVYKAVADIKEESEAEKVDATE